MGERDDAQLPPNGDDAHAEGGAAPRRRAAPWLLGSLVLALLFVLVSLQLFGLWEFITPDTAADSLLLYTLSTLVFVAFFVFSFILVRLLLKLRRERRERLLGSKIKTRLVVYFIAVSLLPITGLAVFSYLFLNRSLEKWFSSFPEGVVEQARAAQRAEGEWQSRSLRDAAGSLAVPLARAPVEELEALISESAARGQLSALAVVSPDGGVLAKSVGAGLDAGPESLGRLLQAAGGGVMTLGGKTFDVVVAPLGDGRQLVAARERRADPQLSELVQSSQTFENFKRRQRKVRLLGLSTLGLLTLMLLFAATWSAVHLARGIGTPIRALAEASDEVARGNFAHRVTAVADDELAVLAASFNAMTAQLEENRNRLEANAGELEANASELREKNLALAERRGYIETVLESLSTGVVSLDAENRVTTINAAAAAMLRLDGVPRSGATLGGLFVEEDRAVLEKILGRARRAGHAAWQMELSRGATGDGGGEAGLPVALTATALGAPNSEGRVVVLVIEDLTELLAAQRAAAWSEVARRMAHEIKNPLTPIQLSAERIARQFERAFGDADAEPDAAPGNGSRPHAAPANVLTTGAQLPARESSGPLDLGESRDAEIGRVARIVADCTATITREVSGLKAMVDEFSRFARLPHARLEPADLNEVVRQSVTLYEDRLGGVRLDVLLAPVLPAAMLDPEQMRRVLVNLIDNALEAVEGEGGGGERRVTVATGHDPARGLLLVEVADTGHGVARRDLPRLFQPYFTTRGQGTGLGLAIVQRVVTDHGGRIRAEQNHPRGARFVVELPAAEETNKMSDVRCQMSDQEDSPAPTSTPDI